MNDGPFDPVWQPARYPGYASGQAGAWRPVFGETDFPDGIVWTNFLGGAGVVWVTHSDAVESLRKHFTEFAFAGQNADAAYQLAGSVPGTRLGREETGQLQRVTDELADIMTELNG